MKSKIFVNSKQEAIQYIDQLICNMGISINQVTLNYSFCQCGKKPAYWIESNSDFRIFTVVICSSCKS